MVHSAEVMSSIGDERRLAAHRQPDVAGLEPLVDRARRPRCTAAHCVGGVRQGDPRVLVDPPDRRCEYSRVVCAMPVDPVIARRRRGCGVADERDVTLAGEQARRRVHADPAGARDVHLGPGVQVGEVRRRAGRPVQRRRCRRSAAPGSRRRTGRPGRSSRSSETSSQAESRHEPIARAQRVVRGLHARLHPHRVADVIAGPRRSAAPGSRRSRCLGGDGEVLAASPVTSGPGPLPGSRSSTGRRYGSRSSARSAG